MDVVVLKALGDADERDRALVEQVDQTGEVHQRAGEPIDLVDDDAIDLAGLDIVEQAPQARALQAAAGKAAVIVAVPHEDQPSPRWLAT
jgi:hypothetical protein